MKPRFHIPLQWKLILPALILSILGGWVGHRALRSAWSQEYEHTLLDFSLKRLRAANHEREFKVRERYDELMGLSQTAYRELTLERTTTGSAIFQAAGPTLRREILAVSFYEGDISERPYFSYVNWGLLKTEKLPRDIQDQINQKFPLNAKQFENTGDLTLVNRSILNEHGEPLPILSFLFTMEAEGNSFSVVADLKSDFLSPADEQGVLGEVFWMKRDGSLISHPSTSLTQRYADKSLSHEIRPFLERATASAEHVLVKRERTRFLSSVIPTSYKGIYAVSEIPVESIATSVSIISWNLGLILCGWVAALLFIYTIVGGQIVRQIKTLEFNMQISRNLSTNTVPEEVTPITTDPPVEAPVVREEPLRLPKVLQVESTTIAFYQPPAVAHDKRVLWDVTKIENQLWMFLGTVCGDISTKPDLAMVAKKVLAQTRFSPEGKPTVPLAEQIKKLNDYMFQEFSGKTWIQLTAVQLNLMTGEMKSVAASNESPYLVSTENPLASSPKDEQSEKSPSVGLRGDTQFKMSELVLRSMDGFCLFQKVPAFAEVPPLSFRGEIKSLALKNGFSTVGQLRQSIFTSTAREKLQQALMLAVVQFQKPAEKPAAPPAEPTAANKPAGGTETPPTPQAPAAA